MYNAYVNVKTLAITPTNTILIIEIKLNWDNCPVCVNASKNISLLKNPFKNGTPAIDRAAIVMTRFILGNS
ncbi:Uncharacterised protein [Staphylococcus aureus]|nr:Uncharacterised protein [Staphylococcus aureus]CPM78937.1 Uncharacterised protein [Staphylococcus aureus]